jgi:dCTP diphosphatase
MVQTGRGRLTNASGLHGSTNLTELESLRGQLRDFAAARDWEQFHSPKNLAMALSVEAGELLEIFQWLTEEQSRNPAPEVLVAAGDEVADVLLYLIRLCDQLGIDPIAAANRKFLANARKYPADKARGSSRKYTEL